MDSLAFSILILLCFSLSGIAQVFWLKSKKYDKYAYPIDFGKSIAGQRIFGENKTFAAFIVMTPVTTIIFVLLGLLIGNQLEVHFRWGYNNFNWMLLGLCGGLGFHLGELPNSFLKRRLRIPPGKSSQNPLLEKVLFVLDHTDSLFGAIVCMSFIIQFEYESILFLIILAPIVHWLFNVLLYWIGFKALPR